MQLTFFTQQKPHFSQQKPHFFYIKTQQKPHFSQQKIFNVWFLCVENFYTL